MASISLPPQSHSTMISQDFHSSSHPVFHGHSRRNLSMSSPLPNPQFVFPARDPDHSKNTPPSTSPAVLESRGIRTPPSLPAFSFNPGSVQASQPSPPQHSPTGPPTNRPTGHRRRPSEFVGGDRLVTPPVAETNQTKDENPLQCPEKLPAPGPGFSAGGPGKRSRHAHRRSAAISSVDLTAISNALNTQPALGSAPVVPADRKRDNPTFEEIPRPMSHSATSLPRCSPPASPTGETSASQPTHPVPSGFLAPEQLPSSPVLVETPRSTPEIHPEQAARNSGPPAIEISPSNDEKSRIRPKTADASWLFDQSSSGTTGNSTQSKRPLLSAGHTRHKSLSSGLLDAALKKKNYANEDAHLTDLSGRSSSSDDDSDASAEIHEEFTEQPSKKKSKSKTRKKKVRSWAGSILTRGKGKRNPLKKEPVEDKNPAPPALTRTNSELGSGLDVDFDDDNMVILRAPTNTETPPNPPADTGVPQPTPSLDGSWKPRSFYEQGLADDTLTPVIDLDAALGPFNTPDMRAGQTAPSSFSAATKRMYSGGRRGEFVGPEMRYHRRTESAPEMPPFDRSALGNHRLTGNSTLENPDVFYEEEEDAFLAATSEPSPEEERRVSQAGSVIYDEPSTSDKDSSDTLTRQPAEEEGPRAEGLGIQGDAAAQVAAPLWNNLDNGRFEQEKVAEQVHSAKNPFANPPRTPVDVIRQEVWQHNRAPAPPSPDVSPRFLPADKRPSTSPIDLGPNIPPFSLNGGSSQPTSGFPSPVFTNSPPDGPRSVTTPSTMDRTFFIPPYNNMSAEFPHGSVEDVPSLTSSTSTSTNPLQRFSATFFPRRGSSDRAASFSAAVHRRTSASHAAKRSSLASLSKLVVSPHANERSKLSYEEKPPGDAPEKGKKKGRGIGRLKHLWRTKDKEKNHGDTDQ